MKKLIILFLMNIAMQVYSQQRPQYTQYIFNNYLLNPALSGIENYMDLKAGYRKQWTGIQNAPQTSFIAAHWMLGDEYLWKNALSFPEKGDNPMSRNYMQNYTSSPAHHGMGLMAVLDKTGPLSRVDASLTYAYHLQLNDQLNLSTGIAAGISRISLDVNALELETANDPALKNVVENQIKPDLGIGVWLYGARFFAGASAMQILPQKLAFTSTPNSFNTGKEVPHFFLTSGYKFFLAEDVAAIPSVMIKYVNPVPLSVDLNMKVAFKDKLWLGGSYRKNDSYSALFGFNVARFLTLTYSYDNTISDLNMASRGSHEIVLGLLLNNKYEVPSSIRMW